MGFAKRGNSLKKKLGNNVGIIEFQRSRQNTSERLIFTINLAVIHGDLLDEWRPPLDNAVSMDGQLVERIGWLLPEGQDKWWEITKATDQDALVNEVSDLIRDKGAPYIQRYLDVDELIALWESNKSPGLTAKQRDGYLERIKKLQDRSKS